MATGTGRVPVTLLSESAFKGTVVGLDASREMLTIASNKLAALSEGANNQVDLVQQVVPFLPFADHTFDAVTCLEALEFFPSDESALIEMKRVLRPGGFLMTSRRRDWEGKLFLTRYRSQGDFESLLTNMGFVEVTSHLWELNYDMAIAWKPTKE